MPEFFNTPLIFSSFIKRFAIRGREYLRTLGKYYIIDIGLRNFLLVFRNRDRGHAIENVVCFELLRRSYDVAIGKIMLSLEPGLDASYDGIKSLNLATGFWTADRQQKQALYLR